MIDQDEDMAYQLLKSVVASMDSDSPWITDSQLSEMIDEVTAAIEKFDNTGSRQEFIDWQVKWGPLVDGKK